MSATASASGRQADASASQDSQLSASALSTDGDAAGSYQGGAVFFPEYVSNSWVDVTFDVNEAVRWESFGEVFVDTFGTSDASNASVRLDGPGGVVFHWFVHDDTPPLISFSEMGILDPGQYRLRCNATADSGLSQLPIDSSAYFRLDLLLTPVNPPPVPVMGSAARVLLALLVAGAGAWRLARRR